MDLATQHQTMFGEIGAKAASPKVILGTDPDNDGGEKIGQNVKMKVKGKI